MGFNDFIMTIDSDSETLLDPLPPRGRKADADPEGPHLNFEFTFDVADPYLDAVTDQTDIQLCSGRPISVDDIIARRRLASHARKRKRENEDDVVAGNEDSEDDGTHEEESTGEEGGEDESGEDLVGFGPEDEGFEEDPLASSGEEEETEGMSEDSNNGVSCGDRNAGSSSDESEQETQAERIRKAAYFDSEYNTTNAHGSFLTMNLSRPILKAVTTLGFQKPTPIQAATIPVALLGKDVVGGAVTGSGKTAAFIIPMLERLLYREKGKKAAATRCLVLVPTRELAVQCFEVGTKLATYTDIRYCLIVGGLSLKSQETELRGRPDIIIATPGRLIDHIRNSPSFTLDALDILVLDEADRMLSEGFADELTELIKSCPVARQTMLFSATMTDSVDELVKLSLNKPVRLFVDPKRGTSRSLMQEFVRVRAGKEAERSALLVALCKRTFRSGVIIFFRSKKLAHQMRIMFSLLDMKCEELHGDLSQEQRLTALKLFRDGAADYLLATDLASRGLDIKGIETVINYDMPGQLAQYLHRVGRTARAGRKGRSVTLVGEADRKILKAAIKHGTGADQVRHRVVPPDFVAKWASKLAELKDEVSAVLQQEQEEKHLRRAEMQLKKGENIIEHATEIYSRPARTWFQTIKEKAKAEAVSKHQYEAGSSVTSDRKGKTKQKLEDKPRRDKYAGLSRKAKRRKMALAEMDDVANQGVVKAAIRSAKKSGRPAKIGVSQPTASRKTKTKHMEYGHKKVVAKMSSAFDRDLGQSTAFTEGVRAKKGDIPASGKKQKWKGK